MSNTKKIKLDLYNKNVDKFIKVNITQNVDFLNVLSLELNTKDFYQSFNSDYGVLIGRVNANNGIGIPNAKVSIFIPLAEEDKNDPEIRTLYPYDNPETKNVDGKRYNLLPRVAEYDENRLGYYPKQPFGSFPIKPEIITNKNLLNVYKKYYKFSTVTNENGDYMIFGAPIGLHTVHMSVDITDIGKYSMSPHIMSTELGYSSNFFTNNKSKIKESNDLDDLPHIETQDISVNIRPFWGDKENFEIGLTRQDFRIRAELVNTFTVFGSAFTDGSKSIWGSKNFESAERDIRDLYRLHHIPEEESGEEEEGVSGGVSLDYNMSSESKRPGKITEQIFYFPNTLTDEQIESYLGLNIYDPFYGSEYNLLPETQYTSLKRDGNFVYIIACNRKRIIINEEGEEEEISPNEPQGIFTEFKGFFTFDIDQRDTSIDLSNIFLYKDNENDYQLSPIRGRVKIPQYAELGESFCLEYPTVEEFNDNETAIALTSRWRKQHKTFKGGKFYTISKFHPTVKNNVPDLDITDDKEKFLMTHQYIDENGFLRWVYSDDSNGEADILNDLTITHESDPWYTPGLISRRYVEDDFIVNATQNLNEDSTLNVFGANWLNFGLYLPQIGHLPVDIQLKVKLFGPPTRYLSTKSNTYFTRDFRRGFVGYQIVTLAYDNPHVRIRYDVYPLHRNQFLPNTVDLSGGMIDISRYLRSDIHWTDFVEVELEDIVKIYNEYQNENIKKGFTLSEIDGGLKSKFRNGERVINDENDLYHNINPCPYQGGKMGGDPNNPSDPETYFFLGQNQSHCINYLKELNLF